MEEETSAKAYGKASKKFSQMKRCSSVSDDALTSEDFFGETSKTFVPVLVQARVRWVIEAISNQSNKMLLLNGLMTIFLMSQGCQRKYKNMISKLLNSARLASKQQLDF
jgi:hypothetical protein